MKMEPTHSLMAVPNHGKGMALEALVMAEEDAMVTRYHTKKYAAIRIGELCFTGRVLEAGKCSVQVWLGKF